MLQMINHFMFALSSPYDNIYDQDLTLDSLSNLNTEGDQTHNYNNTNCNNISGNFAKIRFDSHCKSKRFKKHYCCSCNWQYSSRSCRNYWKIFVMSKYSFMDLCRLSKGININLTNLFYIKLMESFTTNSVTEWIKKTGIVDRQLVNLGGLLGVLGDALIYKANEMYTNLVNQIAKANLVTGVPLGQNEILPDALAQQKQFADALLTGVAPDSKKLMDFFTNRLAELELRRRTNYCQRCGTIKHEKFSDCTRRCNKCMGNHETVNCYINRVCRWCSKLKGHSTPCTKPFYGFRKNIICPICGLKGHFGIECSPIFIALSSLFFNNNRNYPRRRRRTNKNFIVRRGRRTFVLRRWRKRN